MDHGALAPFLSSQAQNILPLTAYRCYTNLMQHINVKLSYGTVSSLNEVYTASVGCEHYYSSKLTAKSGAKAPYSKF